MLTAADIVGLAYGKAQPVAWGSTLVMLAIAAVLVVVGSTAFAARDLR